MFDIETDDYGDEIWFGGDDDGTITVCGEATTWYAGGMKQDATRWNDAMNEARLIAAAPDMLAALMEIQANPNDPRAHRMALDAIAKAKGESE